MSNYLLEIGVEELPAYFAYEVIDNLKNLTIKWLNSNRLNFKDVEVYTTPRRITVYIKDIDQWQEPIVKEVKGPAKSIAIDKDGNYTQAAYGFAKAQNMDISELKIKKIQNKEFLFAIKVEEGISAQDLLSFLPQFILKELPIPKAMKWSDSNLTFIRPIHWFLSLLDDKVIPFSIENIKSDRFTYGHRILCPKKISIDNTETYFEQLKQNFVIVNHKERENLIIEQLNQLADNLNAKVLFSYQDQNLLKEVNWLVEYPCAILGEFDREFLNLPDVLIMTVMRVHQRYFPLIDSNNNILPYFVIVSNGNKEASEIIKKGNERVIQARLNDAAFYFKNDMNKKLIDRIDELKNITFLKGLGSMYDKVIRLKEISTELLNEYFKNNSELLPLLQRATFLCKADLTTQMVKEFTELQGKIGYYYALKQGEEKEVAIAIKEHYLPTGEWVLPETPLGKILSIADKIDNLVSCFALGLIPTGSKDPYALRRQVLGLIAICEDSNIPLNLNKYLNLALNILNLNNISEVHSNLNEFVKSRFRQNMIDRGFRYDIVDAVLNAKPPLDNLLDTILKIKSLQSYLTTHKIDAEHLLTAINRAIRITKNLEIETKINTSLFQEEAEFKLYNKYIELQDVFKDKIITKNYLGALNTLLPLIEPINEFFDKVMVMVENIEVKNNRLSLLESIEQLSLEIADFSYIVM